MTADPMNITEIVAQAYKAFDDAMDAGAMRSDAFHAAIAVALKSAPTRREHIPGAWRCAKCGFRLVQSYLNASDGSVTARDAAGEKCPNCAVPLWRVSWKDEAQENMQIAESQMNRAIEAEGREAVLQIENGQLRAALKLSDPERRQWFITFCLERQGHLNRADISAAFGVSVPQAALDIRKWLESHPGAAIYNTSARRYEASPPASVHVQDVTIPAGENA